ncbi:MAG TPA: hypothetical protein VNH22_20655, partial [Blastocatellia bacterium]|nr:hypothetical protein [Blastocatellia bacterium]
SASSSKVISGRIQPGDARAPGLGRGASERAEPGRIAIPAFEPSKVYKALLQMLPYTFSKFFTNRL